jgi:hypothetical protein
MAMPKDMAVYLPHTPEVDDPEAVGPALTSCATSPRLRRVANGGRSVCLRPAPLMPRTAR